MYLNRLKKLKDDMKKDGISILLLSKPEDKYYYSGFSSSNFYIIITENKNYLLTDFRYLEAAQSKKELYEIIKIDNQYTVFDFLKKYNKMNLGFEERHMTVIDFKKLRSVFPLKRLCFAQNIIEEQRIVKDDEEIGHIKQAAYIADKAFEHVLHYIKPGVKEKEIALELEFFMKKQGASHLSFDSIVASGAHSSKPHATASDKVIENGDLLTLDFGCVINGYCSDMTRTLAIGNASSEQKEVYEVVKRAQQEALDMIKASMKTSNVDQIARNIIETAGYGEYFGHGLGHGVGLEVHELPRLSPSYDIELKKNMVVTVEPGIYLPQKFGVRIEDLVVVLDDGIQNLTSSQKELIIV